MSALPAHGGQLRQLAARLGLRPGAILDFSANINPAGPPPAVRPALHAALDNPKTLTLYPDLELPTTKLAIATYTGAPPEHIAIANGFVPLLEATVRALGLRRCLLPVPCFVEYRPTLERAGLVVDTCPATDYGPALLKGEHDAILLANPQNPTGLLTQPGRLEALLAGGKTLLLDEAFIDYLPAASLTFLTAAHPNLVVFRSVTKFHAIPGLRIAYAVSSRAAELTAKLVPWPVTTLAAIAVEAALPDEAYASQSRMLNEERRTALAAGLRELGLEVYPSAANFVLFRLPSARNPEDFHTALLRDQGIAVRACDNYEGLAPGHVRVAVRTDADNQRLLQALANTLSPQGAR